MLDEPSPPPLNRDRLWNILAGFCLGLSALSCLCMLTIFVNPYVFVNPFPPARLPTVMPLQPPASTEGLTNTILPTLGPLPPVWTATPGAPTQAIAVPANPTNTPGSGQTTQAVSSTPSPTLAQPTATATQGGYPGNTTQTATPTASPTAGSGYPPP